MEIKNGFKTSSLLNNYILLEWHFKFLIIAGVWTIAYLSVEEDILEHDLNEGLHLSLMKNNCQC